MRKNIVVAFSISFAVLFAGCMSTPNYPAPPLAGSLTVSSSPLPLDKIITHTSRVGDSQIFVFQTKGGSVLTGLLLGVGGVLINNQLVSQKTEKLAKSISPNQSLDVVSQIGERINKLGPNLRSGSQPAFIVAGAILVSVDADDQVRSALMVNATDASIPNGWSKNYFYHFATIGNANSLGNGGFNILLQSIASDLDKAVDGTVSVILDDLSGKLGPGVPVKITSDFLRPIGTAILHLQGLQMASRGEITIMRVDGKPGLILFPTVDGVHLFQSGQFNLAH